MLAKEITSLQHPIVKTFVKLRTNRKFRYEKKQIVLAGEKLLREPKELDLILSTEKTSLKAKEIYITTPEILKKVTGLENPEGIAALAPMPPFHSLEQKNWILALDGIADPGNLGTLLRSALALGWEGAFLTKDCVDPFNDKALRSAKGATFRLPLQMGTYEDLITLSEGKNVYIADASGVPFSSEQKPNGILILGNEGGGVSEKLKKMYTCVSIPIREIESLNVAAAGAILLHQLRRISC